MRPFVVLSVCLAVLAALAGPVSASPAPAVPLGAVCDRAAVPSGTWLVSFGSLDVVPADTTVRPSALRLSVMSDQDAPVRRVVPVEYSEAYKVRARIHKVASFATLPIFGAMYWVGQDLYDNPGSSESKKGLHGALAGTTGVLFGVNTITGGWNLWEGRKDPHHRGRRMAHGLLMLAADAGFAATGMLAPDDDDERGRPSTSVSDRRDTHRAVALTSMGVATVSYLMMLFWGD